MVGFEVGRGAEFHDREWLAEEICSSPGGQRRRGTPSTQWGHYLPAASGLVISPSNRDLWA